MNTVIRFLRGIDVAPALVGAARGVAEAVVMGAVVAGGAELLSVDWGANSMVALAVIQFGIRALEGLADQIDSSKQRAP